MRTQSILAVAVGAALSSLVALNGATAQWGAYGGQAGWYGYPGANYPLIARPVSAAYDYGYYGGSAFRTDSFPGGGGPG